MIFELALVEPFIVEGAKFWRQAAQGSDQPELRGDNIDNQTKPRLPRKVEPIFCFALRIAERISGCDKIRVQVVAALSSKGDIADLVCGVEGATHQIAAALDVPRPGHNKIPEGHVRTGLVAMQSTLFHQIVAKPAESESSPVIAKVRSENHTKPDISEARSIAVTVLEAEIDHPANHE
jgi:hypothetical protein